MIHVHANVLKFNNDTEVNAHKHAGRRTHTYIIYFLITVIYWYSFSLIIFCGRTSFSKIEREHNLRYLLVLIFINYLQLLRNISTHDEALLLQAGSEDEGRRGSAPGGPGTGILRLDPAKPRRSSAASVEFKTDKVTFQLTF